MIRRGVVNREFLSVLLFVVLLVGIAVVMTLRNQVVSTDDEKPKGEQKEITTPSGLKYIDLKVGTGEKVKIGSNVSVMYTGTFRDGKKFDGNVGNGKPPYDLTVGDGQVIKGWEEGLVGMQKGGKRKLSIPYQLAYGEEGKPPRIPPKTDLYFEIEVVGFFKK